MSGEPRSHTHDPPSDREAKHGAHAPGRLSAEGLDEVTALMNELSRGPLPCPLGDIALEHLASGGKRIRARLALATSAALGAPRARAVPWAAAVELVHNASLVHDDLQDGDAQRRGVPTVWARHGAAQAINAGDLLLAVPYRAAVRAQTSDRVRWRLCESLGHAVERMSRGQSAEYALLDRLARGASVEPAYVQCARDKTGALFAACVEGAALLAGMSDDDATALGASYVSLGLLFQLQDDVLDLFGEKGREKRGNDVREGKVSALVVEHVTRHPEDRAWLSSVLSLPRDETPDAAVEEAIARFEHGGALVGCLDRMRTLADTLAADALRLASPTFAALTHEIVRVVLAPIAACFDASSFPSDVLSRAPALSPEARP